MGELHESFQCSDCSATVQGGWWCGIHPFAPLVGGFTGRVKSVPMVYLEKEREAARAEGYASGYAAAREDAAKVADTVAAEYTKDMTRYPAGSGNREIPMRQSMAADLIQRRVRALAATEETEGKEK